MEDPELIETLIIIKNDENDYQLFCDGYCYNHLSGKELRDQLYNIINRIDVRINNYD